ncbi:MAG: glutathione S-transferase family protein, partial [Gammaproteobacteria bacterium]|nr:glutathione S-transferase family protein [Gammaproteobacteria bacterium]
VDLASKKTQTGKDFYTINPKGAVPTLEIDNGEILTENAVILQYLADTHHAEQLLPAVKKIERYRVLEWLNYVGTELHKSFGPLFNAKFPQEAKETIITPLLKAKFGLVDKHLAQHDYLLGKTFTLPDAYLFVMILWAKHFKFDFKSWPNLSRYTTNLLARKSIQLSLEEEGLSHIKDAANTA